MTMGGTAGKAYRGGWIVRRDQYRGGANGGYKESGRDQQGEEGCAFND